jgi:hypothetical protein
MRNLTHIIAVSAVAFVLMSLAPPTPAQDPGWPRQIVKPGGTLIIYQPQVDNWKDLITITWRQAFQLTPTGGRLLGRSVSMAPPVSIPQLTWFSFTTSMS